MHARRRIPAALLALFIASFLPHAVSAQSLREETSLRLVPASAALYSANLRNREQFQRFVNSRAFAKLKSLPIVQMGLAQLKAKWESEGDFDKLRWFLEQPENQQLIKVLLDAGAHETFVYGDARHGKWLGTLSRMSNRINLAQMRAEQLGLSKEQAIARAVAELFEQEPDLLRVPGTVLGFRLTDNDAARAQLTRLETVATQLLMAKRPEWEDRLSRQQIGDASYLTLKLDGTLVDWNNILDEVQWEDDVRDRLIARLDKSTFSVSLGVRENYLLLSFGEDDSQLRSIGQGSLLVDQPHMLPLAEYFDRPVTSIGYVSAEFLKQVSAVNEQLDQMVEMVRTVLPMVPIGEDVKEDLIKDAELFAEQAKQLQPELGDVSAITFEVDHGYESISYNWSQNKTLDASQPLTIVEHLGGDPIGFYASRRKRNVSEQEFGTFWAGKLGQYVERIGVPFMNPEQKELFEAVKERMLPLLARLDAANRQKFQPGFADGQSAIVLDARTKKTQWHPAMPPADNAVPLPEIACVSAVSDAQLVREGAAEYFDVLQASITAMSEIMPDRVPPIQLPEPQADLADSGTIYSYPLPPVAGLDPAIAPNAGLSDTTMVVSLVPAATRRALESTSLDLTGPLAEVGQRPLGSAWQFKTDRFVQMLRPWVQYGLQLAQEQQDLDPSIASQVATVMDVLECVRTCSGIAYFEDGAVVSRTRTEFQDLEE